MMIRVLTLNFFAHSPFMSPIFRIFNMFQLREIFNTVASNAGAAKRANNWCGDAERHLHFIMVALERIYDAPHPRKRMYIYLVTSFQFIFCCQITFDFICHCTFFLIKSKRGTTVICSRKIHYDILFLKTLV